ncbi:chemotaxis protein CheW [Salinibius halmophilus]|uniref:chemotaxis protein CheW n=1 Tax=Salinibius halmophilus TaxID=1853216 RepID=UPI000E676666|nr:chemotaxis protein CheW [Salinibius halmophilus]
MTLQKKTQEEALSTLLMPVAGRIVMVPNTTIAEIIPYQSPLLRDESGQAWRLGSIPWRGINIPLISYEKLQGRGLPSANINTRIAVFNRVNESFESGFWAMVIQGIPRQLKVNPESLQTLDRAVEAGDAQWADSEYGAVVIPDLDWIEQQLI